MPAARLTHRRPDGRSRGLCERSTLRRRAARSAGRHVGLTVHRAAGPVRGHQLEVPRRQPVRLGRGPASRHCVRSRSPSTRCSSGRLAIGARTIRSPNRPAGGGLLVSPTYGFSGPPGRSRSRAPPRPPARSGVSRDPSSRSCSDGPTGLADALGGCPTRTGPVVVEIGDSRTHRLDLSAVSDADDSEGPSSGRCACAHAGDPGPPMPGR